MPLTNQGRKDIALRLSLHLVRKLKKKSGCLLLRDGNFIYFGLLRK